MEHAYHPESWRDLYVMLGTSSAALIGLLFVATSLHLDEIVNDPVYRIRARNNSIYLLMPLVEAALVLSPQPMGFLGAELVLINSCMLLLPLRNVYIFFYKGRELSGRSGWRMYRAVAFIGGLLLGAAAGICLIIGLSWSLHLLTASCVTFLVTVAMNAWSIMLGVGRSETKAKRR
jgi:hypothetical protein